MYFKSQVDFAINYGHWEPVVWLLSGNYELYHHGLGTVSDTTQENSLHLDLPAIKG